MPWTKRELTLGILALFVVSTVLSTSESTGRPAASPPHPWPFRTQPRTASEQALREAVKWRMRAQDRVIEERESAIERMGPAFSALVDHDRWRRELMARDEVGHLRRALVMARRSAGLARSPQEVYRAVRLLAQLECEAGQHREELREARKLVALAPFRQEAVSALGHALKCNQLSVASAEW